MNRPELKKIIVLVMVLLISIVFISMIRNFIMAILLAGIFSTMAKPLFKSLARLFRGRESLASMVTLLFFFLIIVIPLAGLLGIVAGQAYKISKEIEPWIEQWASSPAAFDDWFRSLPLHDTLVAYQNVILQKAGELIGRMGTILFNSVSSFTFSTINTIFLFFVFLYTMFFFLKEGDRILEKILFYLPLPESVKRRILDRFTSVTRATIKGTLVIGIIQGGLAGVAFRVVGIDSALFWGTIMSVLSIIPAVGSALIWFPAVIILAITGQYMQAIGLILFCSLLVGSIDNVLRPWLVGRDTELHELLIFFGTLGGMSLFGIVGFIIGPIIAALFVTGWDIYAETFMDYLADNNRNQSEILRNSSEKEDNMSSSTREHLS
jgi:predicted PurR-regulated permease PerM